MIAGGQNPCVLFEAVKADCLWFSIYVNRDIFGRTCEDFEGTIVGGL